MIFTVPAGMRLVPAGAGRRQSASPVRCRDTGRRETQVQRCQGRRLVGHDRVNAGIVEDVGHLARREVGRERHVEQAPVRQGQVGQCPGAAVVGQQCEAPSTRGFQPVGLGLHQGRQARRR